jgi:hypothetical protein
MNESLKAGCYSVAPTVIHPHYYGMNPKRDVIAFCQQQALPFCEGNILKYLVRYQTTHSIADLLKAREYLDRLIAYRAPVVSLGADGPADSGAG